MGPAEVKTQDELERRQAPFAQHMTLCLLKLLLCRLKLEAGSRDRGANKQGFYGFFGFGALVRAFVSVDSLVLVDPNTRIGLPFTIPLP